MIYSSSGIQIPCATSKGLIFKLNFLHFQIEYSLSDKPGTRSDKPVLCPSAKNFYRVQDNHCTQDGASNSACNNTVFRHKNLESWYPTQPQNVLPVTVPV